MIASARARGDNKGDRRPRPLEGQVSLMTGASRGIGRAIAFALAGAGSAVVLCARTIHQIEAVAEVSGVRGMSGFRTQLQNPGSPASETAQPLQL